MGSKQTHSNKTKRESVEMYANVFTNEWTVLRMPGWEAGIAVGEDDALIVALNEKEGE